jgi:hypothetical protein
MHMYVWQQQPFFIAIAQAANGAEARRLVLEQIGDAGERAPERERARKFIMTNTPTVWHNANAEFALTDSAELAESEHLRELARKEIVELKARIKTLEAAQQ